MNIKKHLAAAMIGLALVGATAGAAGAATPSSNTASTGTTTAAKGTVTLPSNGFCIKVLGTTYCYFW